MSAPRSRWLPRWSDLHLRTKGLVVVALPVVPMAIFWLMIVAALLRDSPPANTAVRGREIALRLTLLQTALAEAEAGARATLAGGGPDAVARHRLAADRVPTILGELDRLILDDEARRGLDAIETAVAATLEHLLAGPGSGGDDGADPLQAAVVSVAEVRRHADAINDRQSALTTARSRQNRRREIALLVGLFGASILCTVGGVLAALMLAKGIERRIATLSAHADRLARGEPIEETVPGADEIAVLGERLRDASRLLRQRAATLQEVNRELEAFSYSVSHDLRAPLRAIDGFSQVIEEDQADRLDDEGRDALRRVRAAARRMGLLIDELLSLSRIGRLELRREPVDLAAMAASVVSELRRQSPGRDVDVTIADGLIAHGDPRLLRIALQNLLHNAWKYTGRTGGARIEVGATGDGSARVFHVRDNGAGFDMTYAGKLFGAFQRLHADREFEGTGVGLATVQRIIHRHGGRVWAEGAVGRGATFFFTIAPEGA